MTLNPLLELGILASQETKTSKISVKINYQKASSLKSCLKLELIAQKIKKYDF